MAKTKTKRKNEKLKAKGKKLKAKKAKSKRPVLKAEKRKISGRKVKNLRQDNILPAGLYGREIKSISLKVGSREVKEMIEQAGETSLIELNVKGEKKTRPVLMKNPQYDPITDNLIHLDFHQVDLTQKVIAEVPLGLAGKSPAAESGEGVLVQLINEIEVEALPTELPEKFTVDISGLEKVEDTVTVADLEKYSDKVDIKVKKDQVLAKVEALLEEVEEPVPEEEILVEEEEVIGDEESAEAEAQPKEASPKAPPSDEQAGKEDQKKPAKENETKKS